MTERILIWDIPTRLFHWLLAASFAGAWLTSDSERWRDLHVMFGYTLAGLIVFRLVWGLVGSRYARFGSFLFRPGEVLAYARSLASRSPRHYLGHNPVGSLAIFLMLALGLVTAASGYAHLQHWGGEWLEEFHEGAAVAMLVVVGVHVGGVLLSSLLHKENLVRAMVTGRKDGEPGNGATRRHAAVAALLLLGLGALWTWYPAGLDRGQPAQATYESQQASHEDDEEHG